MTKDKLLKLASKAAQGRVAKTPEGAQSLLGIEEIERFAQLVAQLVRSAERERTDSERQVAMKVAAGLARLEEREACAKVVEKTRWSNWFQSDCVEAIRARGNT